jgi:hypothetical protein
MQACASTPSANIDFDSSVDFSKYQSFTWLSENPMKVVKVVSAPRATLQPAVMAAIRTHLEAAGYKYVDDASAAEFLLSFTVGSRENANAAYSSDSVGTSGRGGWATAFFGGATGVAYAQGMLAIDVFDANDRQPVWHGVGGRTITEDDRDNMSSLIDGVVASILADFPPR